MNPPARWSAKLFCRLSAELVRREVEFTVLAGQEREQVLARWMAAFARPNPPAPVRGYYRWQEFSFGRHPALSGPVALAVYLEQWPADYLIFDEAVGFCARCCSAAYPDLSDLRDDLYVAHHNMKWTVVFTHEQPYLGPFFAQAAPA